MSPRACGAQPGSAPAPGSEGPVELGHGAGGCLSGRGPWLGAGDVLLGDGHPPVSPPGGCRGAIVSPPSLALGLQRSRGVPSPSTRNAEVPSCTPTSCGGAIVCVSPLALGLQMSHHVPLPGLGAVEVRLCPLHQPWDCRGPILSPSPTL